MAQLPVALISGRRASSTSCSPTSRPPSSTADSPAGASSMVAITASSRCWQASAHSGVFSDGFHTIELPHTSASAAFQAHTATGKLNAEMIPTGPSGCQVSRSA